MATTSIRKHPLAGRIDEAANGQEALELVKRTMQDSTVGTYDLILLDLDMPIMDGYTACEKIINYIDMVNEERTIQVNRIESDMAHLHKQEQMLKTIVEAFTLAAQAPPERAEAQRAQVCSLYEQTKYKSLDLCKRPFIVAYSALINQEVERLVDYHGFDGCFLVPLNLAVYQKEVLPLLEEQVNVFMGSRMSPDSYKGIQLMLSAHSQSQRDRL